MVSQVGVRDWKPGVPVQESGRKEPLNSGRKEIAVATFGPGKLPRGEFEPCELAITQFVDGEGKFPGDGYKFEFTLSDGALKGRTATVTTGADPSETNKFGWVLQQMAARKLEVGEEVDPLEHDGRLFRVRIDTKGVITKITPFDPKGKKIAAGDSESADEGGES